MKKIEITLGAGLLVSLLLNEFVSVKASPFIFLFGSILGVLYLVANWWMNKPSERKTRTIIISILYGLVSCGIIFSLIFQVLFLTGADQLTVLSFVIFAIVLGIDYLSAKQKPKAVNTRLIVRLSILSGITLIYFSISKNDRIHFTFKETPEFLSYYDNRKDTMEFQDIREAYNQQFDKSVDTQLSAQDYDNKIQLTYKPYKTQLENVYRELFYSIVDNLNNNSIISSEDKRTILSELKTLDSIASSTKANLLSVNDFGDNGYKREVVVFINKSKFVTEDYFKRILPLASRLKTTQEVIDRIKSESQAYKEDIQRLVTRIDSVRTDFLDQHNSKD